MKSTGLRRLVHGASAAVLLLVVVGSWDLLRLVLVAAAALGLVVEGLRIGNPSVAAWIHGRFPVFRTSERTRLSGATWLCLGYLAAACFPAPAPAAGIMVGAMADPAASLAGSWRRQSDRKSLRGSAAACGISATVLYVLGFPILTVALGSLVAAVIERWSGPLNDNFALAPAVALTVWYLA
jgi:dolichol kinase